LGRYHGKDLQPTITHKIEDEEVRTGQKMERKAAGNSNYVLEDDLRVVRE